MQKLKRLKGDDEDKEHSDFGPVESGDIEQKVTCGCKWIDVFRLCLYCKQGDEYADSLEYLRCGRLSDLE